MIPSNSNLSSRLRRRPAVWIAIAIGLWPAAAACLAGSTYCVAPPPAGDDRNSGAENAPWATPSVGMSRLRDGDTLIIRWGVYNDMGSFDPVRSDITVIGLDESGSDSFTDPDRGPLINGTVPGYSEVNNDLWEPYEGDDAGGPIWRTRAEYDTRTEPPYVGGVFEFEGRRYQLIRYVNGKSYKNLLTKEQRIDSKTYWRDGGPVYCGPGLFFDRDGVIDSTRKKRIYIRLEQTEFMQGLAGLPTDPRQVAIFVSDAGRARIEINRYGENTIRNVRIQGLRFRGQSAGFRGPVSGFTFDRCSFEPGVITVFPPDPNRGGDYSGISITNCRFLQSCPDYVAWHDVKSPSSRTAPASSLQASTITLNDGWRDIRIEDCLIERAWDGVFVFAIDQLTISGCNFAGNIDDCVQLSSSASNVCIGNNRMVGSAPGVARTGAGNSKRVGSKWIHHNVIHLDRGLQWVRRNRDGCFEYGKDGELCCDESCDGRRVLNPFGYHLDKGFGDQGDPWTLFGNTVIFSEYNTGANYGLLGVCPRPAPETGQHCVYNNIFIQMTPGGEIQREGDFVEDQSMFLDGNQYYRADDQGGLLWAGVNLAGKECNSGTKKEFRTLDEFRKYTEEYGGWESHGIYGDPELHLGDPDNPNWEYAPKAHTRCTSCYVNLPAFSSPCAEPGVFRGARAPIGGCAVTHGDGDCDGQLTFDDIDPFIVALLGRDGFCKQYPECLHQNSDANCDGEVNFDDITPFVERLTGTWTPNEDCP